MPPLAQPTSTEAIRRRARDTIESFTEEPLRGAMIESLSRNGYALAAGAECRAGSLAVEVFKSCATSGHDLAIDIGTAVELHLESACLFDDVADTPQALPDATDAGQDLALAIAVLACGNRLAVQVAGHVPSGAGFVALDAMQRNCAMACGGQWLDAHLQTRQRVTTEEALEMTSAKSGALGRSAAGFSARLATDDIQAIECLEAFGHDLFTYAQLVDDLRDAPPGVSPVGDYELCKNTVPLTFYYRYRDESKCADGGKIKTNVDPGRDYAASGAGLYGALVAEVFLNRAQSQLARLRALGYPTAGLEAIVKGLKGAPTDAVIAAGIAEQTLR